MKNVLLTPNTLTMSRIVLTVFFILCISADGFIFKFIGAIIFFLASFTDYYDGYVAKKHNLVSDFGKLMESMGTTYCEEEHRRTIKKISALDDASGEKVIAKKAFVTWYVDWLFGAMVPALGCRCLFCFVLIAGGLSWVSTPSRHSTPNPTNTI